MAARRRRSKIAVHHRSSSDQWFTPGEVLDLVREVSPIALDPAAASDPRRHFAVINFDGLEIDGLTASWASAINNGHQGLVFCNPPYSVDKLDEAGNVVLNANGVPIRSPVIHKWTEKALIEAREGIEIIMLTPARTDTKWFHEHLLRGDALAFWRGRMIFERDDQPNGKKPAGAPFPAALTYFGRWPYRFREAFRHRAWVV